MSVQTPTRPITGPAPAIQDPYPTRLAKKPDMPWLNRREKVVKGQAADGPLSQQQLDEFEQRGFLFEPDFLDQREVQELTGHLHELLARDEFRGRDFSVTEPGSEKIRSLFAVHFLSERFRQLARDPRLTGRARQILGGDVYVHQSRINYKPGFHGKGFNWHSDFETWHAEDGMPSMHAVSASIVLTDNHHFNGPLMLIPGSHQYFVPCQGATPKDNWKDSLKSQRLGVPSQENLAELVEQGGIQAPKGPPGSLLLFECNTLHASNKNLSPWPRSNLFFVYNSVDNTLEDPYCGHQPRPDFLANRDNTEALAMHDHLEPL